MPQPRSALKSDLFADDAHKRKIDVLGDPLELIARHIDFEHLAGLIDGLYPRT
ncbi:MAG: IS5/IS1182 family transposase, partial [Ottowia sp.]